MKREPFIYGMPHDEVKDDPQLGRKRSELVTFAAQQLASARMVQFDAQKRTLSSTDLGQIAAKYYLRHQTVEIFSA